MPVRNLDKIFTPASVAVIGASRKAGSVGHTVVRNLAHSGFAGQVYPINPKYRTLEKLPAYASIQALPSPPDLAVICTPAPSVPGLVRECGEAGVRGVIVLSAGFREVGPDGRALEGKLREEIARFDGLRVIGPNCLGILNPHHALNASFAGQMPAKGKIALISQSGALCTSILDWAAREQIGFSAFVSVGNSVDVAIADLIDYFSLDRWTDAIILYIESIKSAREFMSAARAFTHRKPIVAYKAGRFAESAQAAASHTGAMASVDAVYEAAFARAGIVRVFDIDDMIDCAELLARVRKPSGPRLALITNAGGPGVMAIDALIERQGELARLSPETMEKLNGFLPAAWSHNNPVDVLGDAPPERYGQALASVLADPGVDAAIVILTPQAMTDPRSCAERVIDAARHSPKPVLAAWMGGDSVRKAVVELSAAGIPTYASPEKAVRAFMHLRAYSRSREVLYETPKDIPVKFTLNRAHLRRVFDTILGEQHELLTENTSKALLDAYEIPVTMPYVARTANDAVRLAHRIGYPVAMKILSPDITHKTDVGGVALSLGNDHEVDAAFSAMMERCRRERPEAHIEGVSVQRMASKAGGYELIVGMKRDPVFGAVLLVGAGGVEAELLADHALELPPLNERLARRMLESLRCWPLLQGYRGRPAVNVDRLIEVLMRFSYLVADYPQIQELDVNPLLVTPQDVLALDARIVLDREAMINPPRPYVHLAIRPYPEELVQPATLKSGQHVLLRPLRPEDEPLWHAMVAACSKESLWFRFRYVLKETTHEMATRFCYLDYDREMAIVAEIEQAGQRHLIGIGRLMANVDHTEAEYAVLVTDAWQGTGLGSLLTDYCLEICRSWGIARVVAETSPDNARMLHLFRNRGFEMRQDVLGDSVLVQKDLG